MLGLCLTGNTRLWQPWSSQQGAEVASEAAQTSPRVLGEQPAASHANPIQLRDRCVGFLGSGP